MIIEFDKSFSKSLDKIKDSNVKRKIEHVINDFDNAQIITDIKSIKKMVGFSTYYRIRIGDYRVGIELKPGNIARFIVIAHRKDIYKIFP
jgi:mRNA interferase RelE/StbE